MSSRIRKIQKEPDPLPLSGRGLVYVCPTCGGSLELCDTRDGDQAYFCHACGRGQRVGNISALAFRPEQAS